MFKLKHKLKLVEEGFTLTEVLVAILLTTLFVATAMHSVVISAVFKAHAREFAEATNWIQEDLEDVKSKADSFEYTSLTIAAISESHSINVASVNNFAVNDSLKLDSDPINYTVTGIIGTTTLNISPTLVIARSKGDAVVRTTRCKSSVLATAANSGVASIQVAAVNNFANSDTLKVGSDTTNYSITGINTTTQTLSITPILQKTYPQGAAVSVVKTLETGLADSLRDYIASNINQTGETNSIEFLRQSKSTNKSYTVKKTITIVNDEPYNKLKLNYNVFPSSGGLSVANFYTEVIPNAALQCP